MRNLLFVLISLVAIKSFSANDNGVHVEVFSAKSVNSFVLFDSAGSVIIDTTRSSKDAIEVAKLAKAHGELKTIFVTHGHRDHFLGMGALRKEFPKAKIVVANQEIKDEIIRSAKDAAEKKMFRDEPLMYPKSPIDPDGFDYENEITVLKGSSLKMPGGRKLEVITTAQPTEATHESLLYSKDLNTLFASDLIYNGVHLWLARDVDGKAIENWKAELAKLKMQFGAQNIKVFPGHGNPTDSGVFDTDVTYMNEFLAVISKSKTQQEAVAAMINKYPTWESADFILPLSVKTQYERLKK